MGFFSAFGSSPTLSGEGPPAYTGAALHSSAYNLPIPIFWGTRRIAPNVIWQSQIISTPGNVTVVGVSGDPTVKGGFQTKKLTITNIILAKQTTQQIGAAPFATNTVAVPYSGTYTDCGVIYTASFDHLVKVSSSPLQGQYTLSVTTGFGAHALYTFNAADELSFVDISYTYGGSGSATVDTSNSWFVPVIFSLCEGPINAVLGMWDGTTYKGSYQTAQYAYVALLGGDNDTVQPPWLFFSIVDPGGTIYPDGEANMRYYGTAYIDSVYVDCGTGDSPEIPQQAFECVNFLSTSNHGTVYGVGYAAPSATTIAVDFSLAAIIPDLLTNPQYGMGLPASMIDAVSLALLLEYHQAYGIYFSPLLKSATKATSILDRWAQLGSYWNFYAGTSVRFAPIEGGAL
jgi:hypothetical protein